MRRSPTPAAIGPDVADASGGWSSSGTLVRRDPPRGPVLEAGDIVRATRRPGPQAVAGREQLRDEHLDERGIEGHNIVGRSAVSGAGIGRRVIGGRSGCPPLPEPPLENDESPF